MSAAKPKTNPLKPNKILSRKEKHSLGLLEDRPWISSACGEHVMPHVLKIGLHHDEIISQQFPEGCYYVVMDRSLKKLIMKPEMVFCGFTSYFCVNPYVTCSHPVAGDVRLALNDSCQTMWKFEHIIRHSISKVKVAEGLMPLCNLIDWGAENAFHGIVIGPIPDNKEKDYYDIIFKDFPWIGPYFCIYMAAGDTEEEGEKEKSNKK